MIEVITAIISGLLAGGLSPFLYFRQERNSKDIDNEAKQSEEWKKLYEETKEQLDKRTEEIVQLYAQLYDEKENYGKLLEQQSKLSAEHTKCQLLMCEVPSCQMRKPQTGY